MKKSTDTLHLLITCSRDNTRHDVLKYVVENIVDNFSEYIEDSLLVFDNDSSVPETLSLLEENFRNVVKSNKNIGYWSALFWCVNNYEKVLGRKFKYINVIESDSTYYDVHKLVSAEDFLNKYNDVCGSVRTREFSIKNAHLYDKLRPSPNSKRNAWVVQKNHITHHPIWFKETEFPDVYLSNFHGVTNALNKINDIRDIINTLKTRKNFTEGDFFTEFCRKYDVCGVIDGGVFSCSEDVYGHFGLKVVTSSWSSPAELEKFGYLPTRDGLRIYDEDEYDVTCIN